MKTIEPGVYLIDRLRLSKLKWIFFLVKILLRW